ncbi:hypothetical protein F558DRAFT_02447 [Streptomyces sp. AmelKG-A3]|nr:hypothetical protein GA0115247_129020 [Streptomyces sp. PalvLS-984]SDC71083.1 hypothetical protein F558DRAFT_02447 [Streptomyces sp. AmelKG-A3]
MTRGRPPARSTAAPGKAPDGPGTGPGRATTWVK